MATRWFAGGGSATVHPADDGSGFTLQEMQEYAGTDGGPVEIVFLEEGWHREGTALIVDDDGWDHGKRENQVASGIYREHGGVWPIVGDALEARYEALGSEQERWY